MANSSAQIRKHAYGFCDKITETPPEVWSRLRKEILDAEYHLGALMAIEYEVQLSLRSELAGTFKPAAL